LARFGGLNFGSLHRSASMTYTDLGFFSRRIRFLKFFLFQSYLSVSISLAQFFHSPPRLPGFVDRAFGFEDG
jgi:hypothetical protein